MTVSSSGFAGFLLPLDFLVHLTFSVTEQAFKFCAGDQESLEVPCLIYAMRCGTDCMALGLQLLNCLPTPVHRGALLLLPFDSDTCLKIQLLSPNLLLSVDKGLLWWQFLCCQWKNSKFLVFLAQWNQIINRNTKCILFKKAVLYRVLNVSIHLDYLTGSKCSQCYVIFWVCM